LIHQTQPEIEFALEAVRQATTLVRHIQSEMVLPSLTKDDRSPVTIADYASQALVSRLLAEAFPHDSLVAEEDASGLRPTSSGEERQAEFLERVTHYVAALAPEATSSAVCDWIDRGAAAPTRRFWTLDPIDGTKGFLRGDQYAVAFALVVDGQVQVAALGCPNLSDGYHPDPTGPGSLLIAARGQGAWVTWLEGNGEFERLQVSKRGDPALARLLRSFEGGHTNADRIADFSSTLKIQAEPMLMDSQAKYAVLASGKADLLLRLLSPAKPDYREKIWDQAAGALILEEAGGKISDLDGKPLDFSAGRTLANNRGILASNGLLHNAALNGLHTVHA
jgi:3'(2'), 5'-bisphosphate nucleotidase